MGFNQKKILTHSLSNLAGISQIFIDDINGKDYLDEEKKIITLDKILKMKNNEIYNHFIDPKTILLEKLNRELFFYDFSFNYDENELNRNNYLSKLIELFKKDEHLVKLINGKIMENIFNRNNDKNKDQIILEKIIKEEKFSGGDICIFDIIQKILDQNYKNEFKIIYVELEKNYYFSNFL